MHGNTHISDQQVERAADRMRKIIDGAENSCQAAEDALIRAEAAPLMQKALRAMKAWFYCEDYGLGSFYQRGVLCTYAEHMTDKALAASNGHDPDSTYSGNRKLLIWPRVQLHESDEAEAEALIEQALEHERASRLNVTPENMREAQNQ